MAIDDSWIDRIECELIANLRAAIRAMGHTPRLQLIAPCSCACRSGRIITGRQIVTNGKADTPDVIVAKDLTTSLGLRHTLLKWDDGVVDRHWLCSHVGRVAGAVGCTDGSIFLSKDGRMTLSGFYGETLRTAWPDIPNHQDLQSVVAGYLADRQEKPVFCNEMHILLP